MKKKSTRILIIISVFILIGLIVSQFLIIKNIVAIENENETIVKELKELKKENFKTQVTLALTKVRDKLISKNKGSSNIYLDPVKQIQDNYFVVSFYNKIERKMLRPLIKMEFDKFYISDNYKIGVYDCFSDSIIFDENTEDSVQTIPLKWEHDGYYFGVYFLDIEKEEPSNKSSIPYLLILATLVLIIVGFYSFYLASNILKQKKISKITYDFINNMTHELKTPISTISLSTDVLLKLKKTQEDEQIQRYLSIIKTENSRLEEQVKRVLQIAKLDKDIIDLNYKIIDINDVIETCTSTFSVPVQERNGRIIKKLDATDNKIKGDIIHITNVIYNLLDNANKYSPSSPEITIHTYNFNNKLKVVISDKGIGVKPDECKTIFSKFYRVSTGDVHNVKGFGLGLYYVKQIMIKHEGDVEIESTFGKGSLFILTFPILK